VQANRKYGWLAGYAGLGTGGGGGREGRIMEGPGRGWPGGNEPARRRGNTGGQVKTAGDPGRGRDGDRFRRLFVGARAPCACAR